MNRHNLNGMLDVKKQYFNSQNSLNYLGNKNDLFWDYVNLSVYTYNIISESKNLKFSLFSLGVLFYNFINHIVTSYRLLTENMEQEYLIMIPIGQNRRTGMCREQPLCRSVMLCVRQE